MTTPTFYEETILSILNAIMPDKPSGVHNNYEQPLFKFINSLINKTVLESTVGQLTWLGLIGHYEKNKPGSPNYQLKKAPVGIPLISDILTIFTKENCTKLEEMINNLETYYIKYIYSFYLFSDEFCYDLQINIIKYKNILIYITEFSRRLEFNEIFNLAI